MKEYKIIQRPFSWTNSRAKFEEQINNLAKQGWRVINVYGASNGYVEAILEKDKNR